MINTLLMCQQNVHFIRIETFSHGLREINQKQKQSACDVNFVENNSMNNIISMSMQKENIQMFF